MKNDRATIIVFHGESGSGKTTLIEHLTKSYPDKFKRLITYTSRSPRKNEVEGVDYHFRPENFFFNNQKLILQNTSAEGVLYGADSSDVEVPHPYICATLRKKGMNRLVEMGRSVLVVQIVVSLELKMSRMKARGDDPSSVTSRVIIDRQHGGDENLDDLNIRRLVLDGSLTLKDKERKILEFLS